MTENEYITEVKRALCKEGYWGRPVSKLVEELRDHLHVKSDALEAQGYPRPDAGQMAATAMGRPQVLATGMDWGITIQELDGALPLADGNHAVFRNLDSLFSALREFHLPLLSAPLHHRNGWRPRDRFSPELVALDFRIAAFDVERGSISLGVEVVIGGLSGTGISH